MRSRSATFGDRAQLKPGQTALIHAGAGGVGHMAIQLAKLHNATVYTTVGSPEKGVDLALDTVGGQVFYNTIPAVRVYGDLVTILEPNSTLGNWKSARQRNLRISLELMLTPALQGLIPYQEHQTNILRQCATLIDQGKIKVHVSQTFPLAEASIAHRSLERGSITGKMALVIE
ncbi:hypothetical protein GLO73106DRAFT_00035480 [Gloeocapsa sp. PCC 73106]|nr:hypothetical protein GLO73106DRAFT_00035480 [Gloeocapsa sp. PCC 73106]